MKTVKKLWFTCDRIYIETTAGEVMSQPLRFFPKLLGSTAPIRESWSESLFGLHWSILDEDISFASFAWRDDDPLTLYHQPLTAPQRLSESKGSTGCTTTKEIISTFVPDESHISDRL
jgi:hypothetical protein